MHATGAWGHGRSRRGGVGSRGPSGARLSPWCVPSIRSVMQKYLEDRGEVTFDKIFAQKIGELGTQGLGGTRGGSWASTHEHMGKHEWAGGLHWWPPWQREWPREWHGGSGPGWAGVPGAAPRSPPCVPCPVTSPHASTNRLGQEAPLTSSCRSGGFRARPLCSVCPPVPLPPLCPTAAPSLPHAVPGCWSPRQLCPCHPVTLPSPHRSLLGIPQA